MTLGNQQPLWYIFYIQQLLLKNTVYIRNIVKVEVILCDIYSIKQRFLLLVFYHFV